MDSGLLKEYRRKLVVEQYVHSQRNITSASMYKMYRGRSDRHGRDDPMTIDRAKFTTVRCGACMPSYTAVVLVNVAVAGSKIPACTHHITRQSPQLKQSPLEYVYTSPVLPKTLPLAFRFQRMDYFWQRTI